MGDFLRTVPQLTLEQFQAFRDERPKEEKWELIDGAPMMMPPPTLIHQRISGNLEQLLNSALQSTKPEWRADREIGLLLPDNEKYNPEPDVTVIDTAIAVGQIYAEAFYFVAEILSENDRPAVLAAKLAFYQGHAPCVGVLLVRQDRVEADLYVRNDAWSAQRLLDPAGGIVIPVIGNIGRLGALYRHTPLWQADFLA